jgi:hypothetical protein
MSSVAEKGDPERMMPHFVRMLDGGALSESLSRELLAAVARSSHPDAVRLMIRYLRSPELPAETRAQAFQHLAGTGGAAGVAAVREAKAKRSARPRWDSDFSKSLTEKNTFRSAKDWMGREWRIVHHYSLGNVSDLFLQEKLKHGFGPPIFLNSYVIEAQDRSAIKYMGVPITKFFAIDWIRVLPDDKTIRLDSDKDGLTDLVERRLGTNEKLPDTDSDQLWDAIDPCPNAAPRPLNDREKIIEACIEARFYDWSGPAILSVEGVRPFELYGYPGTLIWSTEDYNGTLPHMYGTGVDIISFYGISEEPEQAPSDWVSISSDGKTAKTMVARSAGGLNGDGCAATLKKIGDEWFVIELVMKYVS